MGGKHRYYPPLQRLISLKGVNTVLTSLMPSQHFTCALVKCEWTCLYHTFSFDFVLEKRVWHAVYIMPNSATRPLCDLHAMIVWNGSQARSPFLLTLIVQRNFHKVKQSWIHTHTFRQTEGYVHFHTWRPLNQINGVKFGTGSPGTHDVNSSE